MTRVTSAHSLLVSIRIWLCLVAKGLRNAGGICVFGELSMSLLQKSFIIQKNYCLLLALFCFFVLATLHSLWDLSSLTRDGAQAMAASAES